MADGTIFDQPQETSLTAGHRFLGQKTSAGTASTSATFALLGGLAIDSTYNTAADHADITGVAGTLHLVNMSALASDLNFTLPVAASIQTGEKVAVFVTVGDADYEMDLLSGATGDLINGTDHSSTSWSRLFITGEYIEFICVDGATGDWAVSYDGRIPCACTIADYSGTTNHFVSGAANVPAFDTTLINIGGMANLAGDQIDIRRGGNYFLSFLATSPNMTSGNAVVSAIRDDAVNILYNRSLPNDAERRSLIISSTLPIVVGSAIDVILNPDQTLTWDTGVSIAPTLSAVEVLT